MAKASGSLERALNLTSTRETIAMIRRMASEFSSGQAEMGTKGSTKMMKEMGMEK